MAWPGDSRQGRSNPHIRLNSNASDLLRHDYDPRTPTSASPLSPSPLSSAASNPPSPQYSPPYPTNEESARLLKPRRSRSGRFRDRESPYSSPPLASPLASPALSRRTSVESDAGSTRRLVSAKSPFDDSRTPSRAGSDEDLAVSTQAALAKFNILPGSGLLLFPEDVEKDDYLHNPDPNDKDRAGCDLCSKRGLVNVGGLAFLTIGILVLFIGYPILTYAERYINRNVFDCGGDPTCISADVPLLKNIRTGLIDPNTPLSAHTRVASDGSTQKLVFSDEFNKPGRSFYPGDDPYFEAVDLWYGVTQDLEWYDPYQVSTENGTLSIVFADVPLNGLNFRSGMLQSWNQLCVKGGYIEASISLPGAGSVSGFWPGFWTMGNLGRPGYASTTDGLWPYSYSDTCDIGITANQSSLDGTSYLPGMRYPACTCAGAEHPNGPDGGKSRSAPEIDAIEASVGNLNGATNGMASQSAQLAPFDVWYYPNYDFVEVYDPTITSINGYTGGPYQQALSGLTYLNNEWYDGNAYQTYAFEYEPGDSGYITWYTGQLKTWTLDARAIGPNGNVAQRSIPNEPMSLIANLGMGKSFAYVDMPAIKALLPATMRLDFIRVYQDDSGYIGCDPPDYPTTDFIANHPKAYKDPQQLKWEHAGYKWPQNSFVHGC